jgi:hypothetical protein
MAGTVSLGQQLAALQAQRSRRKAALSVTAMSIAGIALGLFAGMTTKGNEQQPQWKFVQSKVAVLDQVSD